jgi:hypothetical protein
VIDRQQLAAALEGLDPREREVLDLSLRRRVPDEALASVYGLDPAEVAQRRTAAIERLTQVLDIQRGADLGDMLQALLEPETWKDVILTEPEAQSTVPSPQSTDHSPQTTGPEVEVEPVELDAAEAEPVLEMLGEPRETEQGGGRQRRRWTAALAAAATVLLPAAGIVAASTLGDESDGGGGGKGGSQTRSFVPHDKGPLAQPFASDPEAASGYAVAHIAKRTTLYASPGGKRKLRIPARTEWGSVRIMGVVRQRGEWLAVQVPELENGDVAWLRTNDAELSTVPWSLHVDLSNHRLTVRKDGRAVRQITIAVGSPGHPTPQGRFSVTDKLKVAEAGSPYGCCVVATNAHQTKLPPGWPGGDRVAFHATSDLSSIGQSVSLGCMRAESDQARWLIETIPLGAPVFIKA